MVEFNEAELGRILISSLKKIEFYDEIVKIVRDNSQGNIYLVGGTVSRRLVMEIYGECQLDNDYDFIVDKLADELNIPEGWDVSYHKFGNPTFKKGDVEIDMFEISDHGYIKKNKLDSSIDNFLAGVPFSIQALVFDIKDQKLIGKDGIEALKTRKFKVHNAESARETAEKKGMSVNERMRRKAETMGFEVVEFKD